jgi:hypothetical protein
MGPVFRGCGMFATWIPRRAISYVTRAHRAASSQVALGFCGQLGPTTSQKILFFWYKNPNWWGRDCAPQTGRRSRRSMVSVPRPKSVSSLRCEAPIARDGDEIERGRQTQTVFITTRTAGPSRGRAKRRRALAGRPKRGLIRGRASDHPVSS